jgi:3-(3-hydroxy-phenyl)propionate hydroxylase
MRPGRSEQGWRYDYMFYQPDFERRLRAAGSEFTHVSLFLGYEAVALSQEEHHVMLHARERENGTIRDITAQYVVGCDGANSLVRTVMSSPLEDLHSTQR